MVRSLHEMERTEAVDSTPKSKRAKRDSKLTRSDSKSDSESQDAHSIETPKLVVGESSKTSLSNEESSVHNISASSPSDNDKSDDSDYGSKKTPKQKTIQRTKKAARRRIEQNWEVSKTFANDIAAEDYIENESTWIKDREVSVKEGMKTFYYCGLVTNKNCPAKAFMFTPNVPGGSVVLHSNGKGHVHLQPKRGIPEAIKREIRRLQEGDINNVEEVMARLTTKNLPLPTHKQLKTFMSPSSRSPKIKLPLTTLKMKRPQPPPSEDEVGTKKRKRVSVAAAIYSSEDEE